MKQWPNIYSQGDGFVVDCGVIDGKRVRKYCNTKTKADAECRQRRRERDLGHKNLASLSADEMRDAVEALRLLTDTGISLTDLARQALERGEESDILVSDLYAEYYSNREAQGLRPKSLESITYREGRFSEDFAGATLADITAPMISDWLTNCRVNPVSQNAYLRAVRTLLNYAVKKSHIQTNCALSLDFVRTRTLRPGVFSIRTARAVLQWCMENKPEIIPYYALGFFAGIRPAELRRLPPSDITLKTSSIFISEETSKTHMRHVKIQPVLNEWLIAYPPTGPIFWNRYTADKLAAALDLDWPSDVCRKSFISYHLARFRDQHDTALEAGHRNTAMLYTHYRNIRAVSGELITADYSADYWNLTPDRITAA